jgi:nucleotide-binding universal stress UspA family protein
MKKVLIAVDDTKGSKAVLSVFKNLVRPPQEVLLLHVQRLEGKSLMIDMLGEAELSTLREALRGTEYKEELDRKSEQILNYYKRELEDGGLISIRTMVRDGIEADEILKVAEDEKVDLIITGANENKGMMRIIAGCLPAEIERRSKVPVLAGKEENAAEVYGLQGAAQKI